MNYSTLKFKLLTNIGEAFDVEEEFFDMFSINVVGLKSFNLLSLSVVN